MPCIAVSMDERLDNIMQEMDMCAHQLLHANDVYLSSELDSALNYVCSHEAQIKDKTEEQITHYRKMLDEMGDFLVSRLKTWGI